MDEIFIDETSVDTREDSHTVTDALPIDFGNNNDSKYYTLQGYEPHSVAEQECGYILDTRNIIFIFFFLLLLLRLYGLLKNTLSIYFS